MKSSIFVIAKLLSARCSTVAVSHTVEPLIKDTPNKGHLSIKDTCFDQMLILSCIIQLPNKGHLSIKDIFTVPTCPLYRDCTVHAYTCSHVDGDSVRPEKVECPVDRNSVEDNVSEKWTLCELEWSEESHAPNHYRGNKHPRT